MESNKISPLTCFYLCSHASEFEKEWTSALHIFLNPRVHGDVCEMYCNCWHKRVPVILLVYVTVRSHKTSSYSKFSSQQFGSCD
jgi:hypothetical protein